MASFSPAAVCRIADELYGLAAEAEPLPGEYDCNFRLHTPEGTRLLKIVRADDAPETVDFQSAILGHLAPRAEALGVQRQFPTLTGDAVGRLRDGEGRERFVRLLSYLPGRLLAHTRPHSEALLVSLGRRLGELDRALAAFRHPQDSRPLKWNLARAEWIARDLDLLTDPMRRRLVESVLERYLEVAPRLTSVPWGVVHNDANDYNVVVDGFGDDARVVGLIDFGDALWNPRVCNLAIATAYALLDKPDPMAAATAVVRGYHEAVALEEEEVAMLFPLVAMRLAVSVTNSARRIHECPDDPYVVISEAPAWAALERLASVHPRFAHYQLRHTCGFTPVPGAEAVRQWLRDSGEEFGPLVTPPLDEARVHVLDLSVASLELGLPDETATTERFTRHVFDRIHEAGAEVGIGRWNEPRLIYSTPAFATAGNDGDEWRTVHLGLDLFLPAGSDVFAPLPGTVLACRDNAGHLDYGPTIVLEHRGATVAGEPLIFHTLYGHLDRASLALEVGRPVARGERLGAIGPAPENGDWPPHLHFQLITDLLDKGGEFPGVARPRERAVWLDLSPDPNLVARIPAACFPPPAATPEEIATRRRGAIGPSLSLSYRRPLAIVRGRGQYLFDSEGRRYLDGYNNVPHVGHNHPRVVRAAQRQLAVLNTNTRYLHENLVRYAERLTAKLPAPLSVCYFVSSGSEATELALRLARTATGRRDLIVSEGAYHGHTTTLIEVSPYKAEGPGGRGLAEWAHKVPVPDAYRGRFQLDDAATGREQAAPVARVLAELESCGRPPAAFLIESIPSVAGQIVLPEGYLPEVYRLVRAAGGLCIADEVQTGFGRLGSHFWAFEAYGVTPDIVALGKPIGNGFPLGAVVTTPEIAAAFANGMEFFATFGGNPVACAVGLAVLDVLEDEGLQAHAHQLGGHFLAGLRSLQVRHEIVGDVRGRGLFLGIELVTDRATLAPAPRQTSYVVDRLRERGILVGTDGLHHNVIKMRGPLVLDRDDVEFLLANLDEVLGEDGARA